MNREDTNAQLGQYRGFYHNRSKPSGNLHKQNAVHYPWINNQQRIPFPRSSGGWFKSPPTNQNYYPQNRAPISPWQIPRPVPPPNLPPPLPPPPPPAKPAPTLEDHILEKVQHKSSALQRQLNEHPDAELHLPSMNNQSDDTSGNIHAALSYLQASADTTAAELSSNKKKHHKKSTQQEYADDVIEIVGIVRQLDRQKRLLLSREIRDIHNKTRNIGECVNIQNINPDIAIKLEVLPEEFIASISNNLGIDMEPLPEDIRTSTPMHDSTFSYLENSNTDRGNLSNHQQNRSFQQPVEPYPPSNRYENNYESSSRSRDNIVSDMKQEKTGYTRRVMKCHIKPGRAECRGSDKVTLKRKFDDDRKSPQPVPPPSPMINIDDDQIMQPPPPIKIGPQISDYHKIRPIEESYESYMQQRFESTGESSRGHRKVHKSESQNAQAEHSERHRSDHRNESQHVQSESNGFHDFSEDKDIVVRDNFKLGSPDGGKWKRKIVRVSKKRVRQEIEAEAQMKLKEERKKDEKDIKADKDEPILQNGNIDEKVSVCDLPASATEENRLCASPEVAENEAELGQKEVERSQCAEDVAAKGATEPTPRISEANVSNLSNVLVLELSKPGTYILAQKAKGKLVNKSTISKTAPLPGDTPEMQLDAEATESTLSVAKTQAPKKSRFKPNSNQAHRKPLPGRYQLSFKAKQGIVGYRKSRYSRLPPKNKFSKVVSKKDSNKSPKEDKASFLSLFNLMKTPKKGKDENTTEESAVTRLRNKNKNLKQIIKQLISIDNKIESLLGERREIYKIFDALSSSDSEDDCSSAETPKRGHNTAAPEKQAKPEKDAPSKEQPKKDNPKKEKPAKFVIISKSDSTASTVNPVMNSGASLEQVLTEVLPNDPEENPNPDSPPDFLIPSMDDLFSIIHGSDNKPSMNEPAVAEEMEMQGDSYAEDSNPVTESESNDMELDADLDGIMNMTESASNEIKLGTGLGGIMNISETMPNDILEPSDNECLLESPIKNPFVKLTKYNVADLQRMKKDPVQNFPDDFLSHSNNNVKIEDSGMDPDVLSEYLDNDTNDNLDSTSIIDFIGWKDPILAIQIIKNLIVAGNDKGVLYYFDTQSAYPIYHMKLCSGAITSMVLRDDGSNGRLYIGSLNSFLYQFDYVKKIATKVPRIGFPIQCLELKWSVLYIGSSRGHLIKFCLANGRASQPIKISQDAIMSIKGTMDGSRKVLVVATRNSAVTVRDASTGLQLRTIGSSRSTAIYSLVLHNNRVYCGTSHDDVLVCNFHDGTSMFSHNEGGGSAVVCMMVESNLLFAAYYNGKVCVYNTRDDTFITSISAPDGLLLSMAIVNKRLVVGTKQNFQCITLPATVTSLL